jgi:hypothetical protein
VAHAYLDNLIEAYTPLQRVMSSESYVTEAFKGLGAYQRSGFL